MEIGYVKSIRGPLAYLEGLPSARLGDLVKSETEVLGFVSALLANDVEVLLVKKGDVRPGMAFFPTGENLSVPVGDFLLGRTIGPLGDAVDGKGPIPKDPKTLTPLEAPAPGVADRTFIKEQFPTGISMIDTLIPIGKGQRELLLGDARSGKTGFILDVIANQKGRNVICVYGCIGKPATDVFDLRSALEAAGALDYTVFVASFSGDGTPLIFLTPRTVLAVATHFQRQGRDVLIVLDDMGSHAKVYREISLLAERTPGREAYPGDIFYEHAHLIERAGNFAPSAGGGSITALPVIELGLTDYTGLISTNLMSMTDGHLLFASELYGQGRRPAVDLFLSVSRVGQQTQNRIQTELAFKIKQLLTEAEQMATLTSFSVELPAYTRLLLARKAMIEELLKQPALMSIPISSQTILLAMPFCPFLEGKDEKFFMAFRKGIRAAFEENPKYQEFAKNMFNLASIDELIAKLNEIGPEIIAGLIKH
jgi:F-type H+/Na+-transporting ATPase subunit alpha